MKSFGLRILSILGSIAIIALTQVHVSFSGGVSSTNCSGCHNSPENPAGSVQLLGAPAEYVPGVTYPLTIKLTDPTFVVGGFSIQASTGTFTPSAGTQNISGTNRLTHTSPQVASGGMATWTFDWVAPATGAPASVTFDFAANAANGNGGSGSGDIGYEGSTSVPLPIELSQFEAEVLGLSVLLKWETQAEINNDFFEIQRSQDGFDFQTLEQINGAGTTQEVNQYSFTDQTPLSGSNYYRIKQVDFNGSFSYSEIRSVELDELIVGTIFPNPAQSTFKLSVESTVSHSAQIEVFDILGQKIESRIVDLNDQTQLVQFNCENWLPGMYKIVLQSSHIPKTWNLIKK